MGSIAFLLNPADPEEDDDQSSFSNRTSQHCPPDDNPRVEPSVGNILNQANDGRSPTRAQKRRRLEDQQHSVPAYQEPGVPVYEQPSVPVYEQPGVPVYEQPGVPVYEHPDQVTPQQRERNEAFEPAPWETAPWLESDIWTTHSCIRCVMLNLTCLPDRRNGQGECLQCTQHNSSGDGKPQNVLCYRGDLNRARFFRGDGLDLTQNSTGKVGDIDAANWINCDRRKLDISFGISPPFRVDVVRYQPTPVHGTPQYYVAAEVAHKMRKRTTLAPYCLVNVKDTAAKFEKYIIDNAILAYLRANAKHQNPRDTPTEKYVISQTYIEAGKYYLDRDQEGVYSSDTLPDEQKLLRSLFTFWLAMRHTALRTAYIYSGDTHDMNLEYEERNYPNQGRYEAPQMVVDQLDSINHTDILRKYNRIVLEHVHGCMKHHKRQYWWVIYITVLILLHEASWAADKFRTSLPEFIKELEHGCNSILAHWHYYNLGEWPLPAYPGARHKFFMSDTSSTQHQLVMDALTIKRFRALKVEAKLNNSVGTLLAKADREEARLYSQLTMYDAQDRGHPWYWVDQMFDRRWRPRHVEAGTHTGMLQ
ncbi:hypothetical protein QQS21_009368 [Conoideocrella luteorostrata]|uniref:Uncharacterized protein n=1 Tax=Conoideocrella luteorostrata TaxID=1105319 RepID=A0AAJ0CJD6_9HYPO|nr:hypothetical protein QQS21_009368 [Conoideocrella luteorostrata]